MLDVLYVKMVGWRPVKVISRSVNANRRIVSAYAQRMGVLTKTVGMVGAV